MNQKFEQASDELLSLAHDEEYIKLLGSNSQAVVHTTFELIKDNGEYHRYDPEIAIKSFDDLVATVRRQVSASIYTAELAREHGFAYFFGGGLHHAMTFGGRGFCMLNDIVIAAKVMKKDHGYKNIWIIDIDAHKGDGTAQILQNDSQIHCMSIHMQQGWPLDSEKNDSAGVLNPWFIPSDIDIPIAQGEEDKYLEKLSFGLDQMLRLFGEADFAFIIDGSDPCEFDELESASLLKLNRTQLLERNIIVYDFFKKLNCPQAYLMSGGYGNRAHEVPIQFFKSLQQRSELL